MNNLIFMAWNSPQALKIHRAHKTEVPFATSPDFTPFGFHHILRGDSSQQHQDFRCSKQEETTGQAKSSETQSLGTWSVLRDLGPKPLWWWGAEAGENTPLFLNAPLFLKDISHSCWSQNQAGLYEWVKTGCQALYFLLLCRNEVVPVPVFVWSWHCMLPACEVWHIPCHLDCKAKGGKKGSLHEDLGQDK